MMDNSKKALVIVALLFVAVLIIGWASKRSDGLGWKITPRETIDYLMEAEYQVLPEDVAYYVEFEEQGYVFVDLRNPYEYVKGNIPTSVNIPQNEIMKEEALEFFKETAADSLTVVLYSRDEAAATGPWLLLRQLGYNNMKVMKGGWNYYANESLDPYDMPEVPKYMVEEPAYDFAAIMELMKSSPGSVTPGDMPEVVVPQRKKKKNVVEGGC